MAKLSLSFSIKIPYCPNKKQKKKKQKNTTKCGSASKTLRFVGPANCTDIKTPIAKLAAH